MRTGMIALLVALTAVPASAQFNVQRKEPPTPEVTATSPTGRFQSGKTHVITYTVKSWDPAAAKASGDDDCLPQSVVRVSPGVYRLTVATKAIGYETDCTIALQAPGARVLHVYVPLIPDAAEKKRYDADQERERQESEARAQREQEEALEKHKALVAAFNSGIGKRWVVKYGSGKTETWTLAVKTDFMAQFKNSDGPDVMVMPTGEAGLVMVMMGSCGGQARMNADGTVQGEELVEMLCKGKAGKWSAKVTK